MGWGLLHSYVENERQRRKIASLCRLYNRLAGAEPRDTPLRPAREPRTLAAEAVQLYESGTSTTQIARLLGASRTTVSAWIKKAGVPLRRSPITDEQLVLARRLRDQGASYASIGRQIGYTASGVRRRLVEADS